MRDPWWLPEFFIAFAGFLAGVTFMLLVILAR